MLEQLSKARFLPSSKIAGFFPLLLSREEKGAIFKLRKKSGFESCSNMSFTLRASNQRQYNKDVHYQNSKSNDDLK